MRIVTILPQFGWKQWHTFLAVFMLAVMTTQTRIQATEVALDHSQPRSYAVSRIDKAIMHFQQMRGYKATIRSLRPSGAPAGGEIIHYAWQRPGHIRMEFERPHRGALLVYDPDSGRVHLWPFGKSLLPPMNLAPDNPLIQSPTGQRVDRSDIGALLDNIRTVQEHGLSETVGPDTIDGHAATHVATTGKPGFSHNKVHRYDVWLDDNTSFPHKVVSHDAEDREIETVLMEDVVIDPDFPPRFFAP